MVFDYSEWAEVIRCANSLCFWNNKAFLLPLWSEKGFLVICPVWFPTACPIEKNKKKRYE